MCSASYSSCGFLLPEFPSLSRIHRFLCQGTDCVETNPGTSRVLLGKTREMAMGWQALSIHPVVPPEPNRMFHSRLLTTDDGVSLRSVLFFPSILFSHSVVLCAIKGCCFIAVIKHLSHWEHLIHLICPGSSPSVREVRQEPRGRN